MCYHDERAYQDRTADNIALLTLLGRLPCTALESKQRYSSERIVLSVLFGPQLVDCFPHCLLVHWLDRHTAFYILPSFIHSFQLLKSRRLPYTIR
jgi:hypothetical protein